MGSPACEDRASFQLRAASAAFRVTLQAVAGLWVYGEASRHVPWSGGFLGGNTGRDTRHLPPPITGMKRGQRLLNVPPIIGGACVRKAARPQWCVGHSGRGATGKGGKTSLPITDQGFR